MKPFHVNVNGEPWNPRHAALVPPPKAKREAEAEWHKGWLVVGHRPGECAAAEVARADEIRRWANMSDYELQQALRDRKREPKPWNEEEWRRTGRKHPAHARPFEVPQAAEEMKLLAIRSGWEDVEVTELAKRK